MSKQADFCQLALAVIETEAEAVRTLSERIDSQFQQACQYLLACQGRVIVIGMGKSGHIGNKIAATLASTGTPAFFVHAGEASHGDMGMIKQSDVAILISYSGKTPEIVKLLSPLKRLDIPIISITGARQSTLAQAATINLDVSVEQEACPLGLAPTTSTTASLVMGDALAIALLSARGFTKEDFARSHPGGSLGRQLLLRIDDLMYTGDAMPIIKGSTLISESLLEITRKKLGIACIIDETNGVLQGVFTDGDLRRSLDKGMDIYNTAISQAMTRQCKTIGPGLLASAALHIMESYKITILIVIDKEKHPIGVLQLYDLLRAGLR